MVAEILRVKDVISNDFVVHKAEYETDAGRPACMEKDTNAEFDNVFKTCLKRKLMIDASL